MEAEASTSSSHADEGLIDRVTDSLRATIAAEVRKALQSSNPAGKMTANRSSYDEAKIVGETVSRDLREAGFVCNEAKCNWEPTQEGKWLGMIVNTRDMIFTTPPDKIKKLKMKLQTSLKTNKMTAKSLASIAGTLSSLSLAVGPLTRLRTRAMYADIATSDDWHSPLDMSEDTFAELKFWLTHYNFTTGYSFKPSPITTTILFTDASDDGYGGYLVKRAGQAVVVGKFSEHAQSMSSTMRELLAVQYSLQSLTSLLANESVRVYVDNFSASRILTVGSAKSHLQAIAINIFQICLFYNIKLIATWVPRELNVIADHYSKLRDTDDWSIDIQSFTDIDERFGAFTIDRFADNLNTKLPRFNSKYHCPNTSGVDAFTENWAHENNWVCPPVSLIGSVFRHMRRCKARGSILVPIWRSSYYWPLLYPNGLHLAPFVKDYMIVHPHYTSSGNNRVFVGRPAFKALALFCNFD